MQKTQKINILVVVTFVSLWLVAQIYSINWNNPRSENAIYLFDYDDFKNDEIMIIDQYSKWIVRKIIKVNQLITSGIHLKNYSINRVKNNLNPLIALTKQIKNKNELIENLHQWKSQTRYKTLKFHAALMIPELKKIFKDEGVPEELIWMAEAESAFNPHAISRAGAVGLYQLMPTTAKRFKLKLNPQDQRFDYLHNAHAAAKYLTLLYDQFEDWPLAIAAYNCGEGRISKLLKKYQANSFLEIMHELPLETQKYVPKVLAIIDKRENNSFYYFVKNDVNDAKKAIS